MRDDYGFFVGDGDHIAFWFGIPQTKLTARVEQRGKTLVAVLTEINYQPHECNLRSLRRQVGAWYKITGDGK
jgi:hypothetical protein